MPTMPSLKAPTDGQRLRAESLLADGFSAADVERFARAEWRVAQRIAVDACTEIHPLSKSEQALVRQWINDLVPASVVIERLREKRASHAERQAQYQAARRAQGDPDR